MGEISHVPGGIILGAMLTIAAGNLLGFPANWLPSRSGFILQVLAGIMLGIKITGEELSTLGEILIPVLIITGVLNLMGILSSLLVWKVFDWDLLTAWLSTSPGRMQDMVILAKNLEADSEKVVTTHVMRITLVVIVTPLILLFWGK